MDMSCAIAEDLLPLYLDGSCSEESSAALRAHLEVCPACRARLERMQSGKFLPQTEKHICEPQLMNYAKRVRRRRVLLGVGICLLAFLFALILALGVLAGEDLQRQKHPHVHEVESGVYNLTLEPLETTAQEAERYVFYTNSTNLGVAVQTQAPVTVALYTADVPDMPIAQATVDAQSPVCTFHALTSAERYMLRISAPKDAAVTVSDARIVSFWQSVQNVLGEIFFE